MASADLLTVGGLTTAVRYGLVQATFPALPVRPLTVHRAVLATALFIVVDVATRLVLDHVRARAPMAFTSDRVTAIAVGGAVAVLALELLWRAAHR